MKVAIVKQVLDICGPWSSVRWQDTTPEGLFDLWPGRALFWEMTCLFKADWFIIPQRQTTDYTRWAVLKHPGREALVRSHTHNVVDPREIPFGDYDLVISIDAILDVPRVEKPLFAYHAAEHKDTHYVESRKAPLRNYDLFLDHLMEAPAELSSIPQAIAFPYVRDPESVRPLFRGRKENAIWVDWRTLGTLTLAGFEDPWNDAAETAAKRLEEVLRMPVRFTGELFRSVYGVNDPPLWGNARRYLDSVSQCKYYLAAGQISGAGQGVPEAASLGCICIGQKDKIYHRMICHPECLSDSLIEMPRIVRRVVNSPDMQEEILAWQDRSLREDFVRKPITILEEAIRLKSEAGEGSGQMSDELRRGVGVAVKNP